MKTITVSVDDETYRRTCARAAEAGTDVDEIVRAYLCEYAETPEERFDRLRGHQEELLDSMKARGGGLDSRENLSREELYDRAVGLIDDSDTNPTATAT